MAMFKITFFKSQEQYHKFHDAIKKKANVLILSLNILCTVIVIHCQAKQCVQKKEKNCNCTLLEKRRNYLSRHCQAKKCVHKKVKDIAHRTRRRESTLCKMLQVQAAKIDLT